MSDAALDKDAHFPADVDHDQRFTLLERDLAKQCDNTNNMFDVIQNSLTALTAVQSAQPAPKHSKLPDTPKIAPVVVLTKNHLCPGLPLDLDRNRAQGHDFLKSCSLYMSLCSSNFGNDQAKILWVLSYMKSRCASDFTSKLVEYAKTNGRDYYMD
jgi:hypothetical protein